MEDNSNSFLIKAMAGALILILALNVIRTESTKKQMDRLATAVDSLAVRVDILENPDFLEIASTPLSSTDGKKIADLAKGLSQLQSKVTALQGKVDNLPSAPSGNSSANAATAGSSKEVSDLANTVSDLQAKVNTMQKTIDRLSSGQQRQASSNQGSGTATTSPPASGSGQSYGRVTITSKVKVEDRYVSGKAPMPSVTTGPSGVVVIGVTMDQVGIVSKATVNSGTTIIDEDVLDACKEAALKTHFGYNPDAPSHSVGTITYTFTAR